MNIIYQVEESIKIAWQKIITIYEHKYSILCKTLPDQLALSVHDRFFLFARSNLPNVLISTVKSFYHSDFLSRVLMHRETKNRGLGTIVTSIQDSKPREKKDFSVIFLL